MPILVSPNSYCENGYTFHQWVPMDSDEMKTLLQNMSIKYQELKEQRNVQQSQNVNSITVV